ncbi:LuxR C-terminal-related transcriptional regulator [Ruania suaedae]|uniref:LuxR C-terminal-related transcriptional regulator n=1 Tax=Ruania suaedae TaxID=2897774 RepID=UPI001E2AFEBA|nr:LuxR C-terminal-related transcriptional regulator [Ruania suaedae]UFU03753.1 LuxR C-terminal-related transcriptional regulator [Ruania suaedae]
MPDDRTVTSNDAERLGEVLAERRALLLTGPAGVGKSHLLRALAGRLEEAGRAAPLLMPNSLGRGIPLGVFAGMLDLPPTALSSPIAVIDAFSRHRSSSVLLVDDVEHLDEASAWVVAHLAGTARMQVVLAARSMDQVPPVVHELYDRGELASAGVEELGTAEASELAVRIAGGRLTPTAAAAILAAAGGNPLHLRELVRGTLADGRLVATEHGWDLQGEPALTPRLAQLIGTRFDPLDEAALDAAAVIAIAGECPAGAVDADDRRRLARAGVIETDGEGWLRMSHALDGEYLRSRCSAALWRDLTVEAVAALRSADATSRPAAARRADLLALDHGLPVDGEAVLALAAHALAASEEPLALRAAEAVLRDAPDEPEALRIAGQACSALGRTDEADAFLDDAQRRARTQTERAAAALACANHRGLAHHDAPAALAVLERALAEVEHAGSALPLRLAAGRWAAVAGLAAAPVPGPGPEARGVTEVLGLVTLTLGGVISGPLQETGQLLTQLRRVPAEVLQAAPGAAMLTELAAVMTLSFTGDVVATRARLERLLSGSGEMPAEAVGTWEYALGFVELLSADAERAHALAEAATEHLRWRDPAGLLPAAQALAGAAALATGRQAEAVRALEAVPAAARTDPKVVMLTAWADAWQARTDRRPDQAADLLLEGAETLLSVQHTYFAGMLAHCAVRCGRRVEDAVGLLRSVRAAAGGGLLELLTRHAQAVLAEDAQALATTAEEALELGLVVTAIDTRLWLADECGVAGELRARRSRAVAEQLRAEHPGAALWRAGPDRSARLSARELQVAQLAAQRLTSKEIAAANGVSVNTVSNQLASAFRKLGVSTRAELREVLGAGSDGPAPGSLTGRSEP